MFNKFKKQASMLVLLIFGQFFIYKMVYHCFKKKKLDIFFILAICGSFSCIGQWIQGGIKPGKIHSN